MSERRQVSRRADGALLRHDGQDVGVEHAEQRSRTVADPDARRVPCASAFALRTIIARTDAIRERAADAGRVAPHEVSLKLLELIARDGDVGEVSESGR